MRDKLGQFFCPEKSVCKINSTDVVTQGKRLRKKSHKITQKIHLYNTNEKGQDIERSEMQVNKMPSHILNLIWR